MIENILSNYGLAGAVILIFYLLMKNELSHLRESIDKLNDNVNKLYILVEANMRRDKDEKK